MRRRKPAAGANLPMPAGQPDLVVNGVCNVNMAQNGNNPTVFYYGNVNIVSGGA